MQVYLYFGFVWVGVDDYGVVVFVEELYCVCEYGVVVDVGCQYDCVG